MRRWTVAAAILFALAAPAAASATSTTSKSFWYWDRIDEISRDVSGLGDMHVTFDDNDAEWASLFPYGTDSANILGFVGLTYPPLYHRIIIGPRVYAAFSSYFAAGTPAGNEYEFSIALMTLVHEAFHWRLFSGDESTVNACALKWSGYYLARDFNVPQTVDQQTTEEVPVETTTEVPVVHVKIVKARVKVSGKWVMRPKRVTTTTYRTKTTTTYETHLTTTTVANPLYTLILADTATFYSQQPPPYNAGTCTV